MLQNEICQPLSPGLGLLSRKGEFKRGKIMGKTEAYIGFMLPVKQNVKKGKDWIVEEVPELCFITSQRKLKIVSDSGYEVLGNLSSTTPRWSIAGIREYLNNDERLPVSLMATFKILESKYRQYLDFQNPLDYTFMALWDIGTYFHQCFHAYPYIHLNGLKNSGKSKVIALSARFSFNAEENSNHTPSTLFRLSHLDHPTLYLDEFELVNKRMETKEDKDIETLLNGGYKKGGSVPRTEQVNGNWLVKRFYVYCPKLLAGISHLKGALPSRCIPIVLVRAKDDDPRGDVWPTDSAEDWQAIRDMLYECFLDNVEKTVTLYDRFEKEVDMANRDWELWKPILTLAKLTGPEVYANMKEYAMTKVKDMKEDDLFYSSWEFKLLQTLTRMVHQPDGGDRFYLLAEAYSVMQHHLPDAKISSRKIGSMLRSLGVNEWARGKEGMRFRLYPSMLQQILERLQVDPVRVGWPEDKVQEEIV